MELHNKEGSGRHRGEMSQIEPTRRRKRELGTAPDRLAAAAKQLRIVREELDDDAGSELAHVEVAIRETEAARHRLE